MKKIANILTDKKTVFPEYYNVVKEKENLIKDIPTLVIGWDFTKMNYPEAKIVEWKINENTFWTFGNREKRDEYEQRVEKFGSIAVDRFVKSIKYIPVNIMTSSKEEKIELNNYVEGMEEKEIYLSNNMAYIYIPSMKTVYGIYLREIEYIGKSVKAFLSKIYNCDNKEIISGKISERVPNNLWLKLQNNAYIIPALLYESKV